MNVSRPAAVVMWFMASVIGGLLCGIAAAILGEAVPTSVVWGGGGFIGVGTLGLGVLAFLAGGGQGGPPAP
ncbi:hypothetical protein [Streptomyces sp. NPDC048623]|uniref:hypothetical protein n=1 Tax=Streptomyces sp. NPDC048623 TaxID=3155761 RepID=UPI00341B0056